MPHLKYGERMYRRLSVRVTGPQASSLCAIANCMSLCVGDILRAGLDEFIEGIEDEPRLFTARIHSALGAAARPPRRRRET